MEIRKQLLACGLGISGLTVGCGPDLRLLDPGPVQLSHREAESMEWSAPVNLGPTINSVNTDNSPALSSDGLSLYFGSVNRPGGFGSTDIWVSRRACTDSTDQRCAWGPPANLGPEINSSVIDAGPHISRDGHWMYLISNRPGGAGDNDIWVSYRQDTQDDFAWETPVNLGPPINTAQLEAGPNLRGSEFYFHRGRTGDTDIYVSQVIGRTFTEPVKVEEVSTDNSFDQRPSTTWEGHEMILASDREGPGGLRNQDLWASTRQGNGQPWSVPRNLGPGVNSPVREQTPTITDDGEILLFSSERPGGYGAFDLYMSVRVRKGQP